MIRSRKNALALGIAASLTLGLSACYTPPPSNTAPPAEPVPPIVDGHVTMHGGSSTLLLGDHVDTPTTWQDNQPGDVYAEFSDGTHDGAVEILGPLTESDWWDENDAVEAGTTYTFDLRNGRDVGEAGMDVAIDDGVCTDPVGHFTVITQDASGTEVGFSVQCGDAGTITGTVFVPTDQ
ncbi:MAG: hypothetical protein ACOYNI_09100 [Acidimicrobiia bacterium]